MEITEEQKKQMILYLMAPPWVMEYFERLVTPNHQKPVAITLTKEHWWHITSALRLQIAYTVGRDEDTDEDSEANARAVQLMRQAHDQIEKELG
jgi:hypothetical protein